MKVSCQMLAQGMHPTHMFKRMALLDLTPGISRLLHDFVDLQGRL